MACRSISRDAILRGGESGPAAVAGKAGRKPADRGDQLRRTGNAARRQAAFRRRRSRRLTHWVERGLPWPARSIRPPRSPPRQAAEAEQIAAARQNFWSFRPPQLSAVAGREARVVAAKANRLISCWPSLEKHGLSPSPPADKRTLLRRLSFDLIGLPPTPEEIDDFLPTIETPMRSSALSIALLASPRYGERWGRHWLDVARYADTKGYVLFQDDPTFPGRTPIAIT